MSRNSEFIPRVNVQPQDTINSEEVDKIESYLNNWLDGSNFGICTSNKCYSRAFIEEVIKLAQQTRGHSVPEAIYNLIIRSNHRQVLWFTYDITHIPYLFNYYDFVSKADALEYKRQLQELKNQSSQKEKTDKQLMDNIERALANVEEQLKEFDDLSR